VDGPAVDATARMSIRANALYLRGIFYGLMSANFIGRSNSSHEHAYKYGS